LLCCTPKHVNWGLVVSRNRRRKDRNERLEGWADGSESTCALDFVDCLVCNSSITDCCSGQAVTLRDSSNGAVKSFRDLSADRDTERRRLSEMLATFFHSRGWERRSDLVDLWLGKVAGSG
jgi:hypothetical protein